MSEFGCTGWGMLAPLLLALLGTAAGSPGGSCAPAHFLKDTELQCAANIVLHANIGSAAACCALCTEHPGCIAWAWRAAEGAAGSCNLKNGTSCKAIFHHD